MGNGQSCCVVVSFWPPKVNGFDGCRSCPAVARAATISPIAMTTVFLKGVFTEVFLSKWNWEL
jgi:hypothetical protein